MTITDDRLSAERNQLRAALLDANEVCRSAFTIAHRIASQFSTIELGTQFGAFSERAMESLKRQHAVILATGGYPQDSSGHNAPVESTGGH